MASTSPNHTPPCPTCGGPLHDDDLVWLYFNRFYCSEACARKAGASRG